MPKEIKLSKTKAYFFATPQKAAVQIGGGFGIATLIGLLIPTCIELTPLGNTKRNAQSKRDAAQDKYDGTQQQLNQANANIVEARQRVIDLDCAKAGYAQFNGRLAAFKATIEDSQKSATDRLRLWQIFFVADTTNTQQSTVVKSYTQDELTYEYFYSCAWDCGKDSQGKIISCCYDWGYHYVTYEYDYRETTTITNVLQNIIQGTPYSFPSLNCGYYSRAFETFAPTTYMSYESDHTTTGDRTKGQVNISFRREFGSRSTASYLLDGSKIDTTLTVLGKTSQADAASDLAQNLYQYFVNAFLAFSAVGADYPALQDRIRNSIPQLIEAAAAINQTLHEDGMVLAEKEEIFRQANSQFKDGLSLWLPLFFLMPIGVTLFTGLLVYVFGTQCADRCTRVDEDEQAPDVAPKDVHLVIAPPPVPKIHIEVVDEPPPLYEEDTASTFHP